MIKVLLFDAYGTLFNEGKEIIPQISEKIARKFGLETDQIFQKWKKEYLALEEKFASNFMTIIEANIISLTTVFDYFQLPKEEIMFFIQLIRDKWGNPDLYADVLKNMKKLEENYLLGIISNGDEETLKSALEKTGINIKFLMTSERAKSYKPQKEIFLKSLKELNVTCREAVYIGNSSVDISGAKNSGLLMIHLNRHNIPSDHNGFSSDHTINSLDDLFPILTELSNKNEIPNI